METAPRSLRLQIVVAGRTNSGKSSFLNLISGQDVAITSPVPGTTTDVVEKAGRSSFSTRRESTTGPSSETAGSSVPGAPSTVPT